LNLTLLEPESDLLLGVLDAVGAVADVASNIDGVVTTDGSWGRSERVGGTEESAAGLDGITSFPDHSADWSAGHVLDESWEERLLRKILVVLLEMGSRSSHELDGSELEAASLETSDDGTNESTLDAIRLDSNEGLFGGHGGVVESSRFFSLICGCTEETLSLGAQVFIDFWIFALLVICHGGKVVEFWRGCC